MKKYMLSLMAMTMIGASTMFAQSNTRMTGDSDVYDAQGRGNDVIEMKTDGNNSQKGVAVGNSSSNSNRSYNNQSGNRSYTSSYRRQGNDRSYQSSYSGQRGSRYGSSYSRRYESPRTVTREVVVVHEPAPMPRPHRVVRVVPTPCPPPPPAPVIVEHNPSNVGVGIAVGAVLGGIIAAACH